jgi:hypothetical protein
VGNTRDAVRLYLRCGEQTFQGVNNAAGNTSFASMGRWYANTGNTFGATFSNSYSMGKGAANVNANAYPI